MTETEPLRPTNESGWHAAGRPEAGRAARQAARTPTARTRRQRADRPPVAPAARKRDASKLEQRATARNHSKATNVARAQTEWCVDAKAHRPPRAEVTVVTENNRGGRDKARQWRTGGPASTTHLPTNELAPTSDGQTQLRHARRHGRTRGERQRTAAPGGCTRRPVHADSRGHIRQVPALGVISATPTPFSVDLARSAVSSPRRGCQAGA